MLNLPPRTQVYFCVMPVDMRRSFDSLAETVRESLGHEPRSGHLFVFRNKAQDRMKVLYWDHDGYALWYKRLEKGKFALPSTAASSIEIDAGNFAMLLNGFDLKKMSRQIRYGRTPVSV